MIVRPVNIIYFGFDFFSFVLQELINDSRYNVIAVFTRNSEFSKSVCQISETNNIPVFFDDFEPLHFESLIHDADVIISASYDNLINTNSNVLTQINIHPSLLPECRGPSPIPWVLLDEPKSAGVTIHELTEELDKGDILISEAIPNAEGLSYTEYSLKCNLLASQLVIRYLSDFLSFNEQKVTQAGGSFKGYYPEKRRTISQDMCGADIINLIDKVGFVGAVIDINEVKYSIFQASFYNKCFTEFESGFFECNAFYLVFKCNDGVIVSPRNGYVIL